MAGTVQSTHVMKGQRFGHFHIEDTLGAGGMGLVYRARDLTLDRAVALKLLPAATAADELARARFEREARAASRLDHPNIATVHEYGEIDGRLFIVMALCDGESLRERLKRGPCGAAECREILDQAALLGSFPKLDTRKPPNQPGGRSQERRSSHAHPASVPRPPEARAPV